MTALPQKVADRSGPVALKKNDLEQTSISSDDAGLTQPLVGNEELWRGTRPHDNYEVGWLPPGVCSLTHISGCRACIDGILVLHGTLKKNRFLCGR
jgi:hypothetical protein